MGFYAKIDDSKIVTDIVYLDPDSDTNAQIYLEQVLGLEGPWIKARNAVNSLNHANPGYLYIDNLDVFMPPKPFSSWVPKHNPLSLNYFWAPPVDRPEDGNKYKWDEDSLSWVLDTEAE
jgi:hypothetical protein